MSHHSTFLRPVDLTWIKPGPNQKARPNCAYSTDGTYVFERHTDPLTGRHTYRRALCSAILSTSDFISDSSNIWQRINEVGEVIQ